MYSTFCRILLIKLLLVSFQVLVIAQTFQVVPADRRDFEEICQLRVRAGISVRTDWEYQLVGGNVSMERHKSRVHTYDSRGREEECIQLDPQGIRQSISIYNYREEDKPDKITEFSPEGEVLEQTRFNYDSEGYLKEVVIYRGTGYIVSKILFNIDPAMKRVKQVNMYSPDSVESVKEYYYGSLTEGPVEQILEFRGENEPRGKRILNRNENRRIQTEEYTNPDGQRVYMMKYTYNPGGELMQKILIHPDGKQVKKAEYTYNEQGLMTGEIDFDENGEIVSFFKYTYN